MRKTDGTIKIGYRLATETRYGGGRPLLGLLDYAARCGWRLVHHEPGYLQQEAEAGEIAGIIGQFVDEEVPMLAGLPVPVVNLSGRLDPQDLPSVLNDDELIGRLAAEHLLARGHRRFAYAGLPTHRYSQRRLAGFRGVLEAHGYECRLFDQQMHDGEAESIVRWRKRIGREVAAQPRPLAVLAANDDRGVEFSRACQDAGLRIPDDVAVLGVDNDVLTCRLAEPELSSVEPHFYRLGYDGAAMLDRLMSGQTPPTAPVRLAPLGVVTRQSTDALAVDDERLSQVLRWVREHIAEGINVHDVLTAFRMKRRTLELTTLRGLGQSPLALIRRQRLEVAKDLLARTGHDMAEVARRAGFPDAKGFGIIFARHVGQPPTHYRRHVRGEVESETP